MYIIMYAISNDDYSKFSILDYTIPKIYEYLSIQDQFYILPYISKNWYQFFEKQKNSLFKELASKFLSKSYLFNDKELNKIVKFSKENNLIKIIKSEHRSTIKMKKFSKIRSELIKRKENLRLPTCGEAYFGLSHFEVTWDPASRKLAEGKRENFYTCFKIYAFSENICSFWDKNKVISNNFDLQILDYQLFIKKKICSLSDVKNKKKEEVKVFIEQPIRKVFKLQLKMYITQLTEQNLNLISSDHINRLKNGSKLLFNCDKEGRIIQSSHVESEMFFILKIEHETSDDIEIPFLTWKAKNQADYIRTKKLRGKKIRTYKLIDIFYWSVVSKTTQKIAKKMEIQCILEKIPQFLVESDPNFN